MNNNNKKPMDRAHAEKSEAHKNMKPGVGQGSHEQKASQGSRVQHAQDERSAAKRSQAERSQDKSTAKKLGYGAGSGDQMNRMKKEAGESSKGMGSVNGRSHDKEGMSAGDERSYHADKSHKGMSAGKGTCSDANCKDMDSKKGHGSTAKK